MSALRVSVLRANVAAAFKADGRRGWILVAMLSVPTLLQLLPAGARLALRYERGAIGAGEYWRLLSAHAIHLNAAHLIVNLAGGVLVWALVVEQFSARRWLAIAAASIAAIDAGLWWLRPQIDWYVGASGLLHGILAAGFYAGVRRQDPASLIGLPLLLAKLIYEQLHGSLGITAGIPVVSVAHLYGAGGGLLLAMLLRR